MRNNRLCLILLGTLFLLHSAAFAQHKEVVDYVNPYIGNISHLLVPTFPTIQLPNSMLRVYPERADYTSCQINGLPIIVTNHRERSAFKLLPSIGAEILKARAYTYDRERITPYSFDIEMDDNRIEVSYALSHHSAVYSLTFKSDGQSNLALVSENGALNIEDHWISGYQVVSGNTKVYLFLEAQEAPLRYGVLESGSLETGKSKVEGKKIGVAFTFGPQQKTVHLRYGISFISVDQAKKNLYSEINGFDVDDVARKGRALWNETLGRIQIKEATENERTVFYTSYYRTFERPICMSEDGYYWSAFDSKVHPDNGTPFYTDDWIWDTYRAAHPLRILTDGKMEEHILDSYLRMAEQEGNMWMPTFPEVTGDSRRMNGNHAVASVADALSKGLKVDAVKAYEACRKGIEEKTLIPWSGANAGWLDDFYKKNGYIPALHPGEVETVDHVSKLERRQAVAVSLGTAYDEWCLSRIADYLAKNTKKKKDARLFRQEAQQYAKNGLNYRILFNKATGFFHPKDSSGAFIEPFDYRFSGGQGARDYYDENNGWTYRWDVQHNVADLISLMGGRDQFVANLEATFSEPLGKSKFAFYAQLPDHTGNIGQFSMANEPSLHIPYLFNYAGAPWKTQKFLRIVLQTWFRNDLMGVPGDEDGGGMTSFTVFSMLGFYPVTPGIPAYNIGSPVFPYARVRLSNGKFFEIVARNASDDCKYIQKAYLNGVEWNKPWFAHSDLANGGRLELEMGSEPNKAWGSAEGAAPPSASDME